MKGGKLRHLVTIEKYTETTDDYGELIKGYSEFTKVYAEIRPLLGRENFAEKQVSSEQTHKIKIRYIPDIESTMRIVFNGRIFELIGYPVNFEERNIFLTFNVAEQFTHEQAHP